MRVARAHALDRAVDHRRGCFEVRVTDAEHDDVASRGLGLAAPPNATPRGRCPRAPRARRSAQSAALPCRSFESLAHHFEHHDLATRTEILERTRQRFEAVNQLVGITVGTRELAQSPAA